MKTNDSSGSLTRNLPRYYYSASNADGSITTSRMGGDSDDEGMSKIKQMLGGSIPDGVSVWRSEGVNPGHVKIHPAS